MPNFVALGLMVSDKKIFQDFKKFKFCCHGNQSFRRNQILSRNSEEDYSRNISVKFHQNPISSFREEEKVNTRTDARLTMGHDISSLAYGQWSLKVEQFL